MGFDELQITTMAGTSEIYQRMHPGCPNKTFDILKGNLLYLAERKEAMGVSRPKVSLCYVVVSQNYDGVADFADFACLVRADRVFFRAFFDVDDEELSKLIPSEENSSHVIKDIMRVSAYLKSKGIQHNISNFLRVFKRKLDTMHLYSIIPCYYGWLSVLIDAEGMVYPCCRCFIPLGNIYEKDFNDIWYGKAYQQFRKESAQINIRKTPVRGCDCNHCANWNANLRGYRSLHPIRGRSAHLKHLYPIVPEEGIQ
jgi:radical SAM protein with 4Fe4S-binding SPASM domain